MADTIPTAYFNYPRRMARAERMVAPEHELIQTT